jgi:hypothetical protein
MTQKHIVDGEIFLTLDDGTVANISELVRIFQAVSEQIKPTMTETKITAIIHETCKRMSPN